MDREAKRWKSMVGGIKLPSSWVKRGRQKDAKRISPKEAREARLALKAAATEWKRDYRTLMRGGCSSSDEEGYESVSSSDEESLSEDSPSTEYRAKEGPGDLQYSDFGSAEVRRRLAREGSTVHTDKHPENQAESSDTTRSETGLDPFVSNTIAAGLERLPGVHRIPLPFLRALQKDVSTMCRLLVKSYDEQSEQSLQSLHGALLEVKTPQPLPLSVITRAHKRALAVSRRVSQDLAEKTAFKNHRFRELQKVLFLTEILAPIVQRYPTKYSSADSFLSESLRNQLLVLYCSVEEMADDAGELIEVEYILGPERRRAIVESLQHREFRLLTEVVTSFCSPEVVERSEAQIWRLLKTLRTARRILLASEVQLQSRLGGSPSALSSFLEIFASRESLADRKNLCFFLGLQNPAAIITGLEQEFGSIEKARTASLKELVECGTFKDDGSLAHDVFLRLTSMTPDTPIFV